MSFNAAQAQALQKQLVAEQLMNVAHQVEEKLDAEMKELDNLQDDDIERIRQKRLVEMKKLQDVRNVWRRNGHGQLNEISSDKDIFEEIKGSKKLVVHFYTNTTIRCKILDEHLETLAKKHLETKFLRLNVDKSDRIVQRLNIRVIPTLAFVKDGKTDGYMRGFDDVGGIDDFSTEMLEWRLGKAEIINYKGDKKTPPLPGSENGQGSSKSRGTKIIRGKQNEQSDDEEW